MKYYLGIDGGGTRTTAAVSDETGNVIFKTVGKTINFYSVGMHTARENLSSVMAEIYNKFGEIQFNSAFVGCSALDGEADDKTLKELCAGVINAKSLRMNSDVYVALMSSGDEECRCVAICGTGSMAIGCDSEKTVVKGGWGHIIGDEGSAYSIAVNALKACCVLCDENKKSPLVDSAAEFFGAENFRDIIDRVYASETTKDVLAGFAAKVGALANTDFVAKTIVINEAHAFARTVEALLRELKSCTLLSLYGGVFQHNEIFRECFCNDIKELYPSLKIEILALPPEEGALKVAIASDE